MTKINQPTRRTLLAGLGTAIWLSGAQDQPPNFAGTWKLDVARSSSDRYALPQAMTLAVVQESTKITLHQTMQWQNVPPREVHLSYATDGTESKNTFDDGTVLSSAAKWESAKLIIDWKSTSGSDEQHGRSLLSLSDGPALTYATSAADTHGAYEMIFVFVKSA